jgi:hypothetical protein
LNSVRCASELVDKLHLSVYQLHLSLHLYLKATNESGQPLLLTLSCHSEERWAGSIAKIKSTFAKLQVYYRSRLTIPLLS